MCGRPPRVRAGSRSRPERRNTPPAESPVDKSGGDDRQRTGLAPTVTPRFRPSHCGRDVGSRWPAAFPCRRNGSGSARAIESEGLVPLRPPRTKAVVDLLRLDDGNAMNADLNVIRPRRAISARPQLRPHACAGRPERRRIFPGLDLGMQRIPDSRLAPPVKPTFCRLIWGAVDVCAARNQVMCVHFASSGSAARRFPLRVPERVEVGRVHLRRLKCGRAQTPPCRRRDTCGPSTNGCRDQPEKTRFLQRATRHRQRRVALTTAVASVTGGSISGPTP